jgi:subtilisin family serine protease
VYHDAIVAYQNGASGAGITVGIVDTGIASANAEFAGRISAQSKAFNGTGSIEDNEGHGTAVATVLAAARNNRKTMGMAWNATIMALRTDDPTDCDPTHGCSHPTSYITQAIDHAVARGARVINISLGGDGSTPSLRTAISNATGAGVIIVISSGNDGTTGPDGFAFELADPSISHGLVILATSNDRTGNHSSFANGAAGRETVTLSALGDRVRAQDHTGTEFLWSGTSFSAPQVSGAIALLLQAFPNLTPQQVVDRLLSTAQDAGATGPDAVFGMGIMDLAAAFAPAGTTSLGDSKTPLSLSSNGSLSSAMGDASGGVATSAIAIDALGRAYSISLQSTLGTRPASAVLTPLAGNPVRNATIGRDGISGSINLTQHIAAGFNRFGEMLSPVRDKSLSGRIMLPLGKRTIAALGYRDHGQELAASIAGRPGAGGFLAASDPVSDRKSVV